MMDITARYMRGDFISFLATHVLPEDFETAQEEITSEKPASSIKNTVKPGVCPSLDLSVCEFARSSCHEPRVSLSREAFAILARYDSAASALAVFYAVSQMAYEPPSAALLLIHEPFPKLSFRPFWESRPCQCFDER
ncbi:MAG: hypothetical protein LBF60_03990 [Treponema sp.]|jgi:hypothetical protein|nr:hypothetical protein [Treponema sp.]